jgi:hypothetical protein
MDDQRQNFPLQMYVYSALLKRCFSRIGLTSASTGKIPHDLSHFQLTTHVYSYRAQILFSQSFLDADCLCA